MFLTSCFTLESVCLVALWHLLGVFDEAQAPCCNQGAVGAPGAARIRNELHWITTSTFISQHGLLQQLHKVLKQTVYSALSDIMAKYCTSVWVMANKLPLTFNWQGGQHWFWADDQIKTKTNAMFVLTERSVYEIKSPVSPLRRDGPSLFLDNQPAGQISTDHHSRPL